jgi:NAD(P)H-dependent FMN reductase
MMNVAIILGSTRPGRIGEAVAQWVYKIAQRRTDTDTRFELVDIKDFNLPLLDEPIPPSLGQYTQPHTKRWAAKIAEFDAFVFVTAEYNHGIPGALKNAIDYVFREWNHKAAGFVSYGNAGGPRRRAAAARHGRVAGGGRPFPGDAVDLHRLRALHGIHTRSVARGGCEPYDRRGRGMGCRAEATSRATCPSCIDTVGTGGIPAASKDPKE